MSDAGGTTAASTTAPPAPPPPQPNGATPPAPAAWFSELPPEVVGYAQTKGWADPDAAKVAPKLLKAYQDLESFRAVPADQIFKWPKPDEGLTSVWRKLGVPEKPDGYAFPSHDWQQTPEAQATRQLFSELGIKANLTEEQVGHVLDFFNEAVSDLNTGNESTKAARIEEANAALRESWGPHAETNMALVENGMARIAELMQAAGNTRQVERTEGALAALRDAGFGDWGNELLRVIGKGLGEDRLSRTSAFNAPSAQTKEEAKFEMSKYRNPNSPEGQAIARNDPEAVRRYRELIQLSHAGEEGW